MLRATVCRAELSSAATSSLARASSRVLSSTSALRPFRAAETRATFPSLPRTPLIQAVSAQANSHRGFSSAPSAATAGVSVRASTDADVAAIASIYSTHVLTGTGTFEEVPPSEADMAARRKEVLERKLPYLVATTRAADGSEIVVGFAYANLFRARSAFRFTLENSVYVHPGYCTRRGVGRALLEELIAQLTRSGHRQLLAVIGDSENAASIALHARCGFVHAGTMKSVGLKFGRWLDVVFMQRQLGEGDSSLPAADPQPVQSERQDESRR